MLAGDVLAIVDLSIHAWAPVFESFRNVLGSSIFLHIYPEWKSNQARAVETQVTGENECTSVAEVDSNVVGFVSWSLDRASSTGEVQMLAVHPKFQRRGIGGQLNDLALTRFRTAGMAMAVVGTGGDPGHAPARRSYERAGYTALPIVRYYKSLADPAGDEHSH